MKKMNTKKEAKSRIDIKLTWANDVLMDGQGGKGPGDIGVGEKKLPLKSSPFFPSSAASQSKAKIGVKKEPKKENEMNLKVSTMSLLVIFVFFTALSISYGPKTFMCLTYTYRLYLHNSRNKRRSYFNFLFFKRKM